MDVLTLSHADLVALVQQQQALIAQLEATVAAQAATIQRLEQRLHDVDPDASPPRGMPGHKPEPPAPVSRRPRRFAPPS